MTPPHEPGFIQEVIHGLGKIVEPFIRPINVMSNAISERLAHWLSRKPKLFITFHPQTMTWCIAWRPEKEPWMQLSFVADFTHDDHERTLLLTGAYLEGTKSVQDFTEPIDIPPEQLVRPLRILCVMVHPVVGKAGETWKGRIIFVDQFKRPHKSEKVEFQFVGPKEYSQAYPQKLAKGNTAQGT